MLKNSPRLVPKPPRALSPSDRYVPGSSFESGMYLRLSKRSRLIRGSASADQFSCHRLGRIVGRWATTTGVATCPITVLIDA
jgi:hypothetical protein